MRTAVFIDQQNLYRSARDAYQWHGTDPLRGNAMPGDLARMLVNGTCAISTSADDDPAARELIAVRVYMGLPSQRLDSREHGRAMRQIQHWARAPGVKILHKGLKYPPRWEPGDIQKPREKGVDVSIA